MYIPNINNYKKTKSLQFLPLQLPLHLTNSTLPYQPQRLQLRSRPRKVLNRIIRLHRQQQLSRGIHNINTSPIRSQNVPIRRDFQTIGYICRSEVNSTLIRDLRPIGTDVERVNGPVACSIEGRARVSVLRINGTSYGT